MHSGLTTSLHLMPKAVDAFEGMLKASKLCGPFLNDGKFVFLSIGAGPGGHALSGAARVDCHRGAQLPACPLGVAGVQGPQVRLGHTVMPMISHTVSWVFRDLRCECYSRD
jgi:hypothetical protein